MNPRTDARTTPRSLKRFGQSFCPKCDDMLLAPAASEYVNENLIQHFWLCETCGHEFQTSVRLFALPSPRRKPSAS